MSAFHFLVHLFLIKLVLCFEGNKIHNTENYLIFGFPCPKIYCKTAISFHGSISTTHQILFLDTGLFDCPETIFRNTPEDYGRFPHEYDCTLYHACYKVNQWHIPRENMAHCTFKNVARFYSVCVGLIKII